MVVGLSGAPAFIKCCSVYVAHVCCSNVLLTCIVPVYFSCVLLACITPVCCSCVSQRFAIGLVVPQVLARNKELAIFSDVDGVRSLLRSGCQGH